MTRRTRHRDLKLEAELTDDGLRYRSKPRDKCERCGGRWGQHYPTCPRGGGAYDETLHPHS